MVLTGRFSPSLQRFPWTYCLYALREKLLGSKKSAASKLLAPEGECIFDRFWWDFAKQDTNLASKSTPKDAKMNRHRATRFDSRAAIINRLYSRSNFTARPCATGSTCPFCNTRKTCRTAQGYARSCSPTPQPGWDWAKATGTRTYRKCACPTCPVR